MAIAERTERVRGVRSRAEQSPARARSEPRPSSRLRGQTPLDPRVGAPRYEVKGAIHRGGMGEILLADVVGPDGFARRVVLKGLLERLEDDVASALFLREATLMARLDHPNVVRVFDLPVLDGRPYLAMELVSGRNLHQVIQRGVESRPVPLRLLLHVMAETLRGLHYAHALRDGGGRPLGLVHRDVSPGNILLSFFGEVKLTDFGIARIEGAPRFTAPRSIRGKARYVAPEQVHGHPATVLSDVYSAGVVLAEGLLGRPLWEKRSVPETLMAIVSEPREATLARIFAVQEEVPGLRSALRGALALRPEDRFASALQFAETLESVAEGMGPRVSPIELGLVLRDLFQGDPDVPDRDGFGHSGLPVPRYAMDGPRTASTASREPRAVARQGVAPPPGPVEPGETALPALAAALEALELDDEASDTRRMSPREVDAILGEDGPSAEPTEAGGDDCVFAARAPSPCPVAIPLSEPMIDLSSVGREGELGSVYAGVSLTPVDALPPGARTGRSAIRAAPEPDEDAVAGPFAETLAEARAELRARGAGPPVDPAPLPFVPRDEGPSRREIAPLEADKQAVTLLLAGILIGASLAITGCLVALLAS